jgi:RND family efflux transporter MFP subunit
MTTQRREVSAGLVAALAISILLAGCAREEPPEPAPVVKPVKTMIIGTAELSGRSFPGRVEATSQVDLAFRVGGPLIEFPVREGQSVRKDQLVARIDPRDFQIRLNAAKADFERAEADFRRFSALYEKEAISQAQLDQSRATRDVAAAAVDDAEAELSDTYLRAPFAGRIGETFVENFEDVQAKQAILSLIDTSYVDIVVDVPEALLATVFDLQAAKVVARFDTAPGREFDLRLKEVATQADPRTQTYRATLTMRQPEGLNILPGMTANVKRNLIQGREDEFVVPAIAVVADESGKSHVWIVDQQTMTVGRRPVSLGDLVGTDSIEISDGVGSGEMIAITGVSMLREGMKIRDLSEVEGYER